MSTALQKDLCRQIIESWMGGCSNYIIIAPPMSGETEFVHLLSQKTLHYEFLNSNAHRFSVAYIDSAYVKNDLDFACRISRSWGVPQSPSPDDDAVSILELACSQVKDKGLEPVLIILRFHEALKKLGESIGATLRNLEHTHRLKTVVTMPVKLTTLRERWELMDEGAAPFLASDWGQGHTAKLLSGYTKEEIAGLLKNGTHAQEQAETIHRSTAGYKELVDRISDSVEGKRGRGLEAFLQSRSPELCGRVIQWLEAPNSSHSFKKALVNMEHPNLYKDSIELINYHDWGPSLLSKKGELTFKMAAWASQDFLSRQPGHSWVPTLESHVKNKRAEDALALTTAILQMAGNQNNTWAALGASLRFTQIGALFFSEDQDWAGLSSDIEKIRNEIAPIATCTKLASELDHWKDLFSFLSKYQLHKKVNSNARIERYICEPENSSSIPLFLQFLALRLKSARTLTPFQGLQSVVTMPESILQIYGFERYGIKFWEFQGLSDAELGDFQDFTGFEYSFGGQLLGYADLTRLIAFKTLKQPGGTVLPDKERMQVALEKYELRKELAHSTAFASQDNCRDYQDFCTDLISRASKDIASVFPSLDIDLFFTIAESLLKELPLLPSQGGSTR